MQTITIGAGPSCYSVEEFEGVKVLYAKRGNFRGTTRSKLCVVAEEDLWDKLVAAHHQLSHGGRDRMYEYYMCHNYHLLRAVIVFFVHLCAICQANKGRKSTLKVIDRPIVPENVELRAQADLVYMQTYPDKYYQDCFSKFVILRPLKSKRAVKVAEHLVQIFGEHGTPHILHTDNRREFVNKHLFTAVRRLWISTHLVQGRSRHSQDQGSVKRANRDFKKRLFARLMDAGKETNEWLEQALATRQVTEYAHTLHTPPPPPSPMLLTSLSLQEPTDEIDIAASATLTDTPLPQPCSSHNITTYPSFTPDHPKVYFIFEPIPSYPSFSPLPPSSPIPGASDAYFTDHPLCSVCVIDDGDSTVSYSHCKLDPFHADCLDQIDAYDKTPVQCFCARDEYCRKARITEQLGQGG
ncbi:KRAB-A domain-containing protein 2-like [Oopsacas minuta]|uniref:KRAB-A domain-containing protein 2-like n=1 Tax=Oopsacas minuta TaxID=111878 RepID=A0AAV7K5A4_9METZ|nr:KRAB-A domain-containing protein 2-like [Oopsacas minuta]